jgi:hypothetical protein
MLEECKGEKFFEVLSMFSGLVLKKVLASRPHNKKKTAVARKLATATALTADQQQLLLPLAIAHKVALVNILRQKEEKRKRFTDFDGMLDVKATEINRRIRKSKDTPQARRPAVPPKEADALKRQLKDNWIGNQRWLDVMLHGDEVQAEDAFLNNSFNKVWRMVEQGRKLEDAEPEIGLLENLQLRVEEQQARLQKWQHFHKALQREEASTFETAAKAAVPIKEFRFDDHLELQFPKEMADDDAIKRPSLRPEYHEIIAEMDDELAHIATSQQSHSVMPQTTRRGSSFNALHSPTRARTSRSDSVSISSASPPKTAKPQPPSRNQSYKSIPERHQVAAATPADSDATLVGNSSASRTAPLTTRSIGTHVEYDEHEHVENYEPDHADDHESEHTEPVSDALPTATSPPRVHHAVEPPSPSPSPSPPPPSSYFPSEPPVLEPTHRNSEEALAAQIISTIGDATPSPVKKPQPRMSLMERTRISMAPHTFNAIPESPSLPSPPLPNPEPPSPDQRPQLDRQASLLERTRLSMAAMSARPRASLGPKEKRKSSARTSIFPVNQFDTPRNRKSFMAIEEAKSSEQKTPKEDLFSDEVDYDRVFKSRPRIATSPVWGTPDVKGGDVSGGEEEFDEGVTGVDLGDVDNDEDGDYTGAWENSPSRPVGKRPLFS